MNTRTKMVRPLTELNEVQKGMGTAQFLLVISAISTKYLTVKIK